MVVLFTLTRKQELEKQERILLCSLLQLNRHQKFFWHVVFRPCFSAKADPPQAETAQWIKAGLRFFKVHTLSMQYISKVCIITKITPFCHFYAITPHTKPLVLKIQTKI